MRMSLKASVAALAALACMSAQATDLTGAGSSFVAPVIAKWADAL